MNRRQFLRLATAAALSAGGIALLPGAIIEPARTIFLPPASGWPRQEGIWVREFASSVIIYGEKTTELWNLAPEFEAGPHYRSMGDYIKSKRATRYVVSNVPLNTPFNARSP